jgi:hypothetical protein
VVASHHPLADFMADISIDKDTGVVDIESNLEVTATYKHARSVVRWLRAIIEGYGQGKGE